MRIEGLVPGQGRCRRPEGGKGSMSTLRSVITVAFFVALAPRGAAAIPPPPEVVEQWAREGRLDELAAIQRNAFLAGVNRLESGLKGRAASGVVGGREAVVILVDFDDNPADTASYPVQHFEDMLFSVGTYATGSMRDYFSENSYGQLDLTGTVVGWYRMPRTYAFYTNGEYGFGPYPMNAQKLTEHAVAAADPDVDFALFDNDGPDGVPNSGDDDGYVDALFVVHAGAEGAGGDGSAIWSHAWVTSYVVGVDGVFVYRYSMEPEEGRIGVFCHELGHVLGLPDLYDYDYDAAGVGNWSVMASGSHADGGRTPVHFDAWSKVKLGWVDPIVPEVDQLGVEIPPVETDPVVYKLWTEGVPGPEYFLVEFRKKQLCDTYLPWKGVIVYHVDENAPNNDNQCCGSGSPHNRVAVEQADGECDLEAYRNYGDVGDPFPGLSGTHNPNTTFDANSIPDSRAYDGHDTEVAVRNVSLGDGVATLDIEVGAGTTGVASVGETDAFVDPLLEFANPFEPGSAIRFSSPASVGPDSGVRVRVFDVRGRFVRTLAETGADAGPGQTTWDGADATQRPAASGVYFVVVEGNGRRVVGKLLLAR